MNIPIITSIPIPRICEAELSAYDRVGKRWDIIIIDSPLGQFSGAMKATMIHTGEPTNYKVGDKVKVLMYFIYNPNTGTYEGDVTSTEVVILGKFEIPPLSGVVDEDDFEDEIKYSHPKGMADIRITEHGKISQQTHGISSVKSPYGNGANENAAIDTAQNFHRILSNNPPSFPVREHFGINLGNDDDDKASRVAADNVPIVYRRFVSQNQSLKNWVSTCEGTYDPYLGPNNSNVEPDEKGEVVFSKIINVDDKRVTIQSGEAGEGFFTIRVDKVTMNERSTGDDRGATPGIGGNIFKILISDDGDLVIRGGGSAVPGANFNKFAVTATKDGEFKVQGSGKITLTHGDDDDSNNSIVMDPSAGIDVTAVNGFRVNGLAVVTEAFLDWMNKYQAALCQTTSPGGPAPINPAALAEFTPGYSGIQSAGGFTTSDKGSPAVAIIQDDDTYRSIA